MKIKFLVPLAATLALGAAATATPAAAFNPAPLGYQLMCLKTPAYCRGGGASSVRVDNDVFATLMLVNRQVNRSMRPRADRGGDVWSVNASSGDCEDFAMTKRQRLIQMGLPASALRIAYVKIASGEGHAVLVVKARGRTYVLDNLTSAIRPLESTGYRVISMSGADPLKWS